jgi:hypothetical protein
MHASSLLKGAGRTALLRVGVGLTLTTAAGAQAPGLPVLQGAFLGPGLAAAINVGRSSGRTGTLAAVGFGTRRGRAHLDLGAGIEGGSTPGYDGNSLTYGARIAVRALQLLDERVAVTPFLGFGSTRAKVANVATAGPPVTARDTGRTLQIDQIPAGVAIGGRLAIGGERAVALSVTPFYTRYRQSGLSTEATRGRVRVAGVIDAAVTARIGLTLGIEAGQKADGGLPGPRGTQVGGGVSFAFGNR